MAVMAKMRDFVGSDVLFAVQISMYEEKMERLRQEQKRLQELNSQSEDEVKALSHLHNQSSVT